jgi:hypothetical protein
MNNELNSYKQAIFTAFHNRYMGSNPLTLARKEVLDAEFLATLRIEEGRNYYKVIANELDVGIVVVVSWFHCCSPSCRPC